MTISPFFTSYGTFARAQMTQSITPKCPDVSLNDRLFLFIVNNSTLGETYTFSGDVDDWDEALLVNVSAQTPNAYLYTRLADGSESGGSVILNTTPRVGFFHIAQIFRFSLVNPADYSTTPSHKFLINLLTCQNEPVTTTGDEQLALNFIADRGNDYSFGNFDDETGGTWEEVFWSGHYSSGPPTMGLQVAAMPVPGTIDDGIKVVGVGRNYRIIGLALKPVLDDSVPIEELSAENCGTAWLVLLTIDHEDLAEPIRITTDAVNTISNGETFFPFPIQIELPDDIEGRIPQAQLVVDNTTKEIIGVLRSLSSPANVTIQIVRSEDTDIVEREWSGLKWRNSTYDASAITGTLSVEDIAKEEFPYVTFDGRFKGLFP